jgi:tRNA (guanine37-N1)-methyltransferase
MVIIESISRLIPGVIKDESYTNDSFSNILLDNDVYTHPVKFLNKKVPEVLLSGNHSKIEKFREQNRIFKTQKNRPDLYKKYKELKEKKNGKN